MSVEVTYKGNQIASFTNTTKTLKTSGKYMEGDVAIEESIASGVVTAPASITATGATVSTGTNTLTLSKTVSVTPSVTTEGYVSSGTAGNSDISLTASVNTRTSSDLTANGDTVTVPAGYYGSQATKAVATGSAGTPTATKGTVSNNSVSVTPSVTNTAGYISGGTETGTAVSVSASELVSGNKAITENGSNIDVTNYATVSVDVSGGTAAISVVDTTDAAGGTIRTITALDISDTTAIASDVANGKYFYTAAGVKTQGTASGGGGSALVTETGTFTGSGGITAQISCDFEPREIYIFGDLSNDTSLRGVVSLTIIKDTILYMTSDGNQSAVQEVLYGALHGITNYNENNQSGDPYASYSNGTLTVNTVNNTSTCRFTSGVTYSYKLVGYSSVS